MSITFSNQTYNPVANAQASEAEIDEFVGRILQAGVAALALIDSNFVTAQVRPAYSMENIQANEPIISFAWDASDINNSDLENNKRTNVQSWSRAYLIYISLPDDVFTSRRILKQMAEKLSKFLTDNMTKVTVDLSDDASFQSLSLKSNLLLNEKLTNFSYNPETFNNTNYITLDFKVLLQIFT